MPWHGDSVNMASWQVKLMRFEDFWYTTNFIDGLISWFHFFLSFDFYFFFFLFLFIIDPFLMCSKIRFVICQGQQKWHKKTSIQTYIKPFVAEINKLILHNNWLNPTIFWVHFNNDLTVIQKLPKAKQRRRRWRRQWCCWWWWWLW